MIEQDRELAQRLRDNWNTQNELEALSTIDALVAENEAIRTLMNCYNVGGWTDSLTLIKERDEARAEVERLKQAIQQTGLTLAKTQQGYQLLKLGKIEAQSTLEQDCNCADQTDCTGACCVKQEQAEPVATLWREKNQKLYPGPSWKLTPAGEALPLGVEHHLYTAPQGQTALLRQALEALEKVENDLTYHGIVNGDAVDAAIQSIKQHLGEA